MESTEPRQSTSSVTPEEYVPVKDESDVEPPITKKRKGKQSDSNKAHECEWPGCRKVFHRADHLMRHRLNHEPTKIFHCGRCEKTFVREDLLTRHTQRHDRREVDGTARHPQANEFARPDTVVHIHQPPGPSTMLTGSGSRRPNFVSGVQVSQSPIPSTSYSTFSPTQSPAFTQGATPFTQYPSPMLSQHSMQHSPSMQPSPSSHELFLQSTYGAPYVSASEYDWLFDANAVFDLSFVNSRPPSPVSGHSQKRFGVMDGLVGGWSDTPDMGSLGLQNMIDVDLDAGNTLSSDASCRVDAETRLRVIDYLGPEWAGLRVDPGMTTRAMEEYLFLFWTRIHVTQAPAIHRASFNSQTASTPLLVSMILLGCYFATPQAHILAVAIHPVFRGKVFCSPDFKPDAEIWVYQTALLLMIFGTLCSDRMAHEMSHVFWSSVITLGRRSKIFSSRKVTIPPEKRSNTQARWEAWIEEESSKRIAIVYFAYDVEHAALFRHAPSLSAFQMKLALPCDEDLWDAPNAETWSLLHAKARKIVPFISALKANLTPGHPTANLNPFSRIAILHGLLSVAQDLQWRDHFVGLSPGGSSSSNWRQTISASYNSWKSQLDICLRTASDSTSIMLRAAVSLYAVAHVTLSIDVHELEIFAGSDNALGLTVTPAVVEANRDRIKVWSNSKQGRAATWHAAHFLRSTLEHYLCSTGELAACLHHGYSLYITCLTLYCWGVSSGGPPRPRNPEHQSATMAYLNAMCTTSPDDLDNVSNKNEVLCVCETIFEYIGPSRWEIAQEGARTLRGLFESG